MKTILVVLLAVGMGGCGPQTGYVATPSVGSGGFETRCRADDKACIDEMARKLHEQFSEAPKISGYTTCWTIDKLTCASPPKVLCWSVGRAPFPGREDGWCHAVDEAAFIARNNPGTPAEGAAK